MQKSMEQMYQEALNPTLFPDSRLKAVMEGQDTSIPMAIAMAAKQQRNDLQQAAAGQSAMQQAQKPSVKDQMIQQDYAKQQAQMAQQTPVMQEGLDQLPSGQLQNLAAGGIVAFADGGMADDDEDTEQERADAQEDSYLKAMLGRAGQGIHNFGSQIMASLPQSLPQSYESTLAKQQAQNPNASFQDMGLAAAKKYGAPDALVMHVMHKETGGMKDPANAVSKAGAEGVMQLMPKTAKYLGVENSFDPAQNIDGGVKYLAKLNNKYQSPRLAAMAYNWGEGNVDKWLKHGRKDSNVPKETRMYVADANFAAGGIAHFVGGGLGGYGTEVPDLDTLYNEPTPKDQGSLRAQEQNYAPLNTPAPRAANQALLDQWAQQDAARKAQQQQQQQQQQQIQAQNQGPAPMQQPQGPSLDEYYNRSQSRIDDALEELKNQRKQASGLALFSAGLGMLGKSPFAGENIKEGAAAGIGQYSQDQKGISALQNQIMAQQGALDKNRAYAAIQSDARQDKQKQALDTHYSGLMQKYNADIDKEISGNMMLKMNEAQADAYRKKRLPELIKQDPELAKWYVQNGGSLTPASVQLQSAPGNVLGTLKTQ
jgi:soluble lytic murein transglycosylase-like protein